MLPGDDDAPKRILMIPDHKFSDARLRSAYLRAVDLAERFGETAAFLVKAETAPEQLAPGFAGRLIEEVDLATAKLEKHHTTRDALEMDLVRTVERAAYPDIAEIQAVQTLIKLAHDLKTPGWDFDPYREHRNHQRTAFERRWNRPLDVSAFESAVDTWRFDDASDDARFEAVARLLPWMQLGTDRVDALRKRWTRHSRVRRPPGRPRKRRR